MQKRESNIENSFFISELHSLLALSITLSTNVNNNKEQQHHRKNYGRERSQLGSKTTLARIGIDICREGLEALVTLRKECHGKVVNREREGEDEARHHTRTNLGNDNLA